MTKRRADINNRYFTYIFSSPEHEVFVRRPSSVRCQLFVLNDFSSKTARRVLKKFYRKVPWLTLYQNCSNRSAPLNKMAARAKNRKTFKRLLLLSQKMDFEIFIQECFLGDPLQKLLKEFRYVEQNGRQGYK